MMSRGTADSLGSSVAACGEPSALLWARYPGRSNPTDRRGAVSASCSLDYGRVTTTLAKPLEMAINPVPAQSGAAPSETARAGIVDLCAGIGCVANGFEAAKRFEAIALVDIDFDARRVWEHNHSHVDYLATDIRHLSEKDLLDCADGRDILGVVGCPPCQGFSAAGRRRTDDDRNLLLAAFFDIVRTLAPRFFVMENVPAVLHRKELQAQEDALEGRYAIKAGLVNAALYGLPQTRERAVVIGIDRELGLTPSLPPPTHFGSKAVFSYSRRNLVAPSGKTAGEILGSSPQIGIPITERYDGASSLPAQPDQLQDLVTVWDAIGDLPVLDEAREVPRAKASAYADSLGAGQGKLQNHEPWGHTDQTVERLATISEGGRLKTELRYYSQAYARLHRRGLARTITTNFHNAGCGRFTHPLESRTITVREAARLQGISDEFRFTGHGALQERLVGNAFPPLLAKAVAEHLAAQMDSVGAMPSHL